jgi:hypothetical protein
MPTTKTTRLIPVNDWNEYHQWPPVGGLRHLIFHAEKNGFSSEERRTVSNVIPIRPSYTVAQVIQGLGLKLQPTGNRSTSGGTIRKSGDSGRTLPQEMQIVCKDGERTKTLSTLAGKLIAQGRALDEVIELARAWNSRNNPAKDDDKLVATCEGIMRTHVRNHGEAPAQAAPLDGPLFDLSEARVSKILTSPPPPRRWLLKDFLLVGKVGAVVAPGGTGKSQLLLQLGASVASGLPFLGFLEVMEPGGVLMLMAEDDNEEIHHRLHHIHTVLASRHPDDLKLTARITENLFIRSMVGESNLMTSTGSNGGVSSTGYAERVVLTAKDIPNLKLVVVDPASRFRGGVENSAEDVTRFIEELEYVRKHTGATVIVAHHTNKGSLNATEANQNAARGSSAFSDGVRWQMNLALLTQKQANELGIAEERRRFYLAANTVKNNYAPPSEGILLQRGEGGYLDKIDVEMVTRAAEINLLYQVQQLLRADAKKGRRFTRSSFEDTYGGTDGPLKTAKIPLREFLKRAVKEKKLWADAKSQLMVDGPMPSDSVPSSERTVLKTKT